MSQLVPIGIAAKELGVHPDTLRRWEEEGRIDPPERTQGTQGGRRRYDLSKLHGLEANRTQSARTTIAYARVSTPGQKDDLVRQVALLESFCAANKWNYEVIEDIGSGLNYNKRGLRKVIKRICDREVGRLVISHKDRLLRFGTELVFSLAEQFGTEIIIINASENSSFEEDLASDVIEIVTVFSARLYGSRSHKNRKVVEQLRQVASKVSS